MPYRSQRSAIQRQKDDLLDEIAQPLERKEETANPMTIRRPAEVFPPGEFLREELEYRGWTEAGLSEILGRSQRLVGEMVSGKRGISPEIAKGLAAALGTSAEFWLNLQASYAR